MILWFLHGIFSIVLNKLIRAFLCLIAQAKWFLYQSHTLYHNSLNSYQKLSNSQDCDKERRRLFPFLCSQRENCILVYLHCAPKFSFFVSISQTFVSHTYIETDFLQYTFKKKVFIGIRINVTLQLRCCIFFNYIFKAVLWCNHTTN